MNSRNVGMIEYRRKLEDDLYIIVIFSFDRKGVGISYKNAEGEFIKTNHTPYAIDFTEAEIKGYLDDLAELGFFSWPAHQYDELEEQSDLPNFIYFMNVYNSPAKKASINYTFGDPNDPDKLLQAHKLTEEFIGTAIGDEVDFSDFELIKDVNQLTLVTLNVLGEPNTHHDVSIDIEHKDYMIEVTDDEGLLVDETISNPLRRSKIKGFLDTLEDLKILQWPVEPDEIDTFSNERPFVEYYIGHMNYFTYGDPSNPDALPKLHKAMENLTSNTFGSYKWYENNA